jgi:hypothetical protein
MTNDPMMMTCAQVDDALSDYLEQTLDSDSRERVDEHLASCLRCSAILRDIDAIRAQAAALPELAPSRDLWKGISARIEPTVIPFGARATRDQSRRWLGIAVAAAAALMIVTAGVTYVATSRSLGTGSARVAVAPATSGGTIAASPTATPATVGAPVPEVSGSTGQGSKESESREASPTGSATLASRRAATLATSSELAYGDEIERLQKIITQRRRELDPATVSIVEQNLRIIDAAVRQSRAALARDPKSGFLAGQLNNALDKKVELLRTVALLPPST